MKLHRENHERESSARPSATGGGWKWKRKKRAILGLESLEDRIVCAAGDLDTTFNGTGTQIVHFPNINASGSTAVPRGIAVQADGKTVVAGPVLGGLNFGIQMGVSRLNADGSLDATFGQGGTLTIPIGVGGENPVQDDVSGVVVQPDGKIVVAGTAASGTRFAAFAVARLTPNGSLDTTFGDGGIRTIKFPQAANAADMTIDSSGRIIVAGTMSSGPLDSRFAIARLTPSGALDQSFGSSGEQTIAFGAASSSSDTARAVAIQLDGKIVLAGLHSGGDGKGAFALARLNPDGSLDTSFAAAGLQDTALVGFTNTGATSLAIQPDGGIVAIGSMSHSGFQIARFTSAGSLDTNFNGSGSLLVTFPSPSAASMDLAGNANDVAVQSDGKILVSGDVAGELAGDFAVFTVIRVNADGTLDTTFSQDGKQFVDFDESPAGIQQNSDRAQAMALTRDGKLVVAGSAGVVSPASPDDLRSDFGVARFLLGDPTTPPPSRPTPPSNPQPPSTPTSPTAPTHPGGPVTPPASPVRPAHPVTPPPAPSPFLFMPALQIVRVRPIRLYGRQFLVLMLNQRIASRPLLPTSLFSVRGLGAGGLYDQEARILRARYNPRARNITLALAPRPHLQGSVRLTVHTGGIANLSSVPTTDFLAYLNLR